MQSGYGGVSEMQQFLVDGCGTTLFSISPPPPPPTNPTVTTDIHTTPTQPGLKYHPFHHPHQLHPHPHPHHHPHHQPPPPAPPHFPHFHPIPITQQLFQQSHHQFQLFHHQSHEQRRSIPVPHHHHHHDHHLGLDPESGPENSTSPTRMMVGAAGGGDRERGPPPPPFLAPAMNFKLAVNESSGGGSGEGMNDEEGILQGDDGSESRFHPWQREEESAIKEPFWRPLDIDYINRNNKRCKDKEPESSTNTYCKKSKDGSEAGQENPTTGSNYKLFSELEAIYKPGGGGNYQTGTGSGSALTGDENPLVPAMPPGPAGDPRDAGAGSDTSTHGGETPVAASKLPKGGGSGGRRKRKRRQQKQMSSIAVFFEGLVKQLMDHQEGLHRKFLEVMERRDQERTGREEAWRRQEAAKSAREAAARAEERALSATREAAIISFLEKVTGESLNLPTKSQFQSQLLDETHKEDNTDVNIPWETSDPFTTTTTTTTTINNNSDNRVQLNTSRWPRTEVQALIRVRSALEMRFQEPGLKGPLWEEVSSMMGSMGYQRSSKRCKEKWENINKYFRKTKDSGKKRPQHSKTCPYFQQLDQLYSNTKSLTKANAAPNPMERRDNSELLDAIVVSTDHPTNFNSGPLRIDFNGKEGDKTEPSGSAMAAKESDDEDDDDEGGYEEAGEGEGESQGQWQEQQQHLQNLHT